MVDDVDIKNHHTHYVTNCNRESYIVSFSIVVFHIRMIDTFVIYVYLYDDVIIFHYN